MNDLSDEAFENLFHYYCFNEEIIEWGPEYWKPYGFTVENSEIKIIDEAKFILFVLRWS